jgi:hypothetical protein
MAMAEKQFVVIAPSVDSSAVRVFVGSVVLELLSSVVGIEFIQELLVPNFKTIRLPKMEFRGLLFDGRFIIFP